MIYLVAALQSGKPAFTKSEYKVNFIALLQTGCPAPVIVEVNGKMENYYTNGRLNPPNDTSMDIVFSDFY